MSSQDDNIPTKESWRCRVANVEGRLALVLAIGSWLYAMRPIGPMVGMPVEAFIRDISSLFPALIGFALGLVGIRHGNIMGLG
jgi:hypothetical protein